MGKATRWLRGLLGMKKDKENVETNSNGGDKKDKKRRSFAEPRKDSLGLSKIPPGNIPASDSPWLRSSYFTDSEKEQNKHAIAVAAATAAAADAAVAAAHAAVAVVRLTSQGKGGGALFSGGGGREKWAAARIQSVFRGYLARKALRALKGLVKLQALVRGYLVRKRAAATLHSMQALFRAQTSVRAQRARRSINTESRARNSTESEFHSKRLSSSYESSVNNNSYDESPKIVEIDTCGAHKSRSRRMTTNNSCMSEHSDDQYYQIPARLSIPDCRHLQELQEFDWGYVREDYKFPTAQNTPRFACSGRAHAPATPAKSLCGDHFFRPYSNSNCPSYMANTQSFRAKLRSHSAPRQRPDVGPKKRLSLNEIMASRTSFSGVRMHKACSQVEEDLEF
ncbi:hypothetical protein ABFS83_09G105900 [Erythranthe nasuta]